MNSELSRKTNHKKVFNHFLRYLRLSWMDEVLNYLRPYMEIGGSCDLFYAITSKLDILVGCSGQILAGAISSKFDSDSISFRRPIFSCFSKRELRKQLILVTWQSYSDFVGLTIFFLKVVETAQAASSAKIKPNLGRVITVFRILYANYTWAMP